MSAIQAVERDERTVAVENASYRWTYLVLSFGLLVDVIYRSMIRHEAPWDLMALVILGGAVCTVYQARQSILTHGWVFKVALAVGIAAAIAVILVMTL